MAKDAVKNVTGLTIDWAVAVDFSGFTKLMKTLGGIFVDVPFSFEDTLYPLEGKVRGFAQLVMKFSGGISERNLTLVFIGMQILVGLVVFLLYA